MLFMTFRSFPILPCFHESMYVSSKLQRKDRYDLDRVRTPNPPARIPNITPRQQYPPQQRNTRYPIEHAPANAYNPASPAFALALLDSYSYYYFNLPSS